MKKYLAPDVELLTFIAEDMMASSIENETSKDYVENNLLVGDIVDL